MVKDPHLEFGSGQTTLYQQLRVFKGYHSKEVISIRVQGCFVVTVATTSIDPRTISPIVY